MLLKKKKNNFYCKADSRKQKNKYHSPQKPKRFLRPKETTSSVEFLLLLLYSVLKYYQDDD